MYLDTNTDTRKLHLPQSIMSKEVWSNIKSNRSDVFLHIVLKRSPSARGVQEGDVLHRSVRLIKYDIIPAHFQHRYLLSDFGLFAEGK